MISLSARQKFLLSLHVCVQQLSQQLQFSAAVRDSRHKMSAEVKMPRVEEKCQYKLSHSKLSTFSSLQNEGTLQQILIRHCWIVPVWRQTHWWNTVILLIRGHSLPLCSHYTHFWQEIRSSQRSKVSFEPHFPINEGRFHVPEAWSINIQLKGLLQGWCEHNLTSIMNASLVVSWWFLFGG